MGNDLTRRLVIFAAIMVAAILFLGPTFAPSVFPERWISKPVSLGLDLKGGVHLVYEVDAKEAVKSRLESTADAIRSELRKDSAGKIPVVRTAVNQDQQVEITLLNDRLLEKAKEAVAQAFREVNFVGTKPGEGQRVILQYGITAQQAQNIEREAINQAVETLRNRVDQFGVAEPLIQKVGTKRILLQMPGVSDIKGVKNVVGSVAKLEFRLVPNAPNAADTVTFKDRDGNDVRVDGVALMSGDAVDTARATVFNGKVAVSLTLTSEGARTFKRVTTENVGRQFAIILDGKVHSAPVIREPIRDGRAEISGGFTLEEARQLAVVLRAGALPAPLIALEERTVGPTLGQQSIESGIIAILVGFGAIALFMVTYYKKAGVVAVCTLAINLILVLAGLSAFGATLTLPGLAGLALTAGMAVDANVIIFERIRDELRNGAGRDAAVIGGFEKAFSAILDSNVTTLLSGIILFYFGTGPLRGFAVTLCIGIFTTMYCAVTLSRLAFDTFSLKGKSQPLSV